MRSQLPLERWARHLLFAIAVLLCYCITAQVCDAREFSFRRSYPQSRRNFVTFERTSMSVDDLASVMSVSFAFRTFLLHTRIASIAFTRADKQNGVLRFSLENGSLAVSWIDTRIGVDDINTRYHDGQWHNVSITFNSRLAISVDETHRLLLTTDAEKFNVMFTDRSYVNVVLRGGNLDFEFPFFGCFRLIGWGDTDIWKTIGKGPNSKTAVGNELHFSNHLAQLGCSDLCSSSNSNAIVRCAAGSQCFDHFDFVPSCDWISRRAPDNSTLFDRILTLNGGDFLKYELNVEQIPLYWQRVTFNVQFLLAEDEHGDDEQAAAKPPMQLVQFEATPDGQTDQYALSVLMQEDALLLQRFVNGRRVNRISLFTLPKSATTRFWHTLSLSFIHLDRLTITVTSDALQDTLNATFSVPSGVFFDRAYTKLSYVYLGGNVDDSLGLFRGCLRHVYINEANLIQQIDLATELRGGFLRFSDFVGSLLQLAPAAAATSRCRMTNPYCGPSWDEMPLSCENGGVCARLLTENRCFCTKFFNGRSCQFPVYLRSCDHYYRSGIKESGYRYLQPVSTALRQATPALAFCDMETASDNSTGALSIVSNDANRLGLDSWLRVRGPPLSNDSLSLGSVFRLHYDDASWHFLVGLTTTSVKCEQQFRYRSFGRHSLRLANSTFMMTAHQLELSTIEQDSNSCWPGNDTQQPLVPLEECCQPQPAVADGTGRRCTFSTKLQSPDSLPITDVAFFPFLSDAVGVSDQYNLEVQFGNLKCYGTKIAGTELLHGITLFDQRHSVLLLPAFRGNTFAFVFRLEDNRLHQEIVLFEQSNILQISLINQPLGTLVRTRLINETIDLAMTDSLGDMLWHQYELHFESFEARVQVDFMRNSFARLSRTKLNILQVSQKQAESQQYLQLLFNQTYAVIRDVQYGDPPTFIDFAQTLDRAQTTPQGIRLGTALQCDNNKCRNRATCKEDWANRRATCQCIDPIGQSGEFCDNLMSSRAVSLDGSSYSSLQLPDKYLESNMTFYFRTWQLEAVVLSLFAGDWNERYALFLLVDGHLCFEMPYHTKIERVRMNAFVADGNWHRVRLVQYEDLEKISVHLDDGEEQTLSIFMFFGINSLFTLYLGGIPAPSLAIAEKQPFFEGCFYEIVSFSGVNGNDLNLRDFALRKSPAPNLNWILGGIHADCTTACDTDAAQQSCKLGNSKGRCVPLDWQTNKATCDCPNSWFAGNDCSADYGLCFAEDVDIIANCRRKHCPLQSISFSFKLNANVTMKENVIFHLLFQFSAVEFLIIYGSTANRLVMRQRIETQRADTLIGVLEPDSYQLVQISKLVRNGETMYEVKTRLRNRIAETLNITALHKEPFQYESLVVGRRYVGCMNNFIVHANGKVRNLIEEGLSMMHEGVNSRNYSDMLLTTDASRKSVALRSGICRVDEGGALLSQMRFDRYIKKRFAVSEKSIKGALKAPAVRVFPLHSYLLAALKASDQHMLSNVSTTRANLSRALTFVEDAIRFRDETLRNLSNVGNRVNNLLPNLSAKLANLTMLVYPTIRLLWSDLNVVAPEKHAYVYIMDRIVPEPALTVFETAVDDFDWVKLVLAVVFVLSALVVLIVIVVVRIRINDRRRRNAKASLLGIESEKYDKAHSKMASKQVVKSSENGLIKTNGVRYTACNGDDHMRLIDHTGLQTSLTTHVAYPSPPPSQCSNTQTNYVRYDDIDSQRVRPPSSMRESVIELYDDELNRPIGSLRRVRALRFESDYPTLKTDAPQAQSQTISNTNTNTTLTKTSKKTRNQDNANGTVTRSPNVFRKGRSSHFNDSFMMFSIEPDHNGTLTAASLHGSVSKAPVAKLDSTLFQTYQEPLQIACFDSNGNTIEPEQKVLVFGSTQIQTAAPTQDATFPIHSCNFPTLTFKDFTILMASEEPTPEFPPPPSIMTASANGILMRQQKQIPLLTTSANTNSSNNRQAELVPNLEAKLANETEQASVNDLDNGGSPMSPDSTSGSAIDPIWVKTNVHARTNTHHTPARGSLNASQNRGEEDVIWLRQMG